MTAAQVRDLIQSWALWRQAQGGDGPRIETIVPAGTNRLVLTFAEHRAVITVGLYERHTS